MTHAQTSDRVSSIAARYVNFSAGDLRSAVANGEHVNVAEDIRSMAGSLLRQDETLGKRFKRLLSLGE